MTNPIESQVPHDLNAGGEVGKERLEEMLAQLPRTSTGTVRSNAWTLRMPATDLESILTELLVLRGRK